MVSGLVTISANAADAAGSSSNDSLGVVGVRFQADGNQIGSIVTGTSPYQVFWNSTTVTNGIHTLSATAIDEVGNSSNTSISVTVNNPLNPPALSGVSITSITGTTATINWTTSVRTDTQVAYGTSSGYGSLSGYGASLVTSHTVILSGLSPITVYHFQALSRDGNGNLGTTGDLTFSTTQSGGLQTLLQLQGNATEVSGVSNGATVTPASGPSGFSGAVVARGSGSVNFAPAQVGNGVYFLNCCANTNNAYYKFSGAAIGNIFNSSQGQISFYLQSRYSFTQRKASAGAPRYTFDVHDNNLDNHLFYFLTEADGGYLQFSYAVGGNSRIYYVPSGSENTLFGAGVNLGVTVLWNAGTLQLYLNNVLVQTSTYTAPTPNWSALSNLDLGAYEFETYGGYNTSDDIINAFTVSGPAH